MIRLFTFLIPVFAMAAASLPLDDGRELVVNNHILAKINGKTISVVDVMKKMDLHLNQYYPHLANSATARYQFYSSSWRDTLNQMIDSELMVADAETLEVKVSEGEVRQEIQERFGPNIMTSLSKLGLTYEEAKKLIHQEMVVQRMNWFRITSKALQRVTPQDVKEAYKQFCENNPPKEEWKYQMLSIRANNRDMGAELAQKAFALLKDKTLHAASEELKASLPPEQTASINLSQEYAVEDRALAQSHKEVLTALKIGEITPPIEQISRDNSVVFRFFQLNDHTISEPPKFETIANELKENLLQKAASDEMGSYVNRLRQRFGYDESSLDIPKNFEPFILR
jgi:hypothetical protein